MGVAEARNILMDAAPEVFAEFDPSVITEGRREPPALPWSLFGDPWAKWIKDAAESQSCPPDYVAGALLAAAGVLIGNSRWASPWEGFVQPPIIWMALVGPPSSGKSPACDVVLNPLREIENEIAGDLPAKLRQWETDRESAEAVKAMWVADVKKAHKDGHAPPVLPENAVEPEKPVRPRLIVSDATQEALAGILAASPRGVMFTRDELTGWLESFDRYSKGGERAFWLEAFGGRPYVIDRVKHVAAPLRISHLSVPVLGGIQPDRLASTILSDDDDGLAARLFYIWPSLIPPKRPAVVPDWQFISDAFRRLFRLPLVARGDGSTTYSVVMFADDAAAKFDSWRGEHFEFSQQASGMYAGHLGKMPGAVVRLALMFEYLWWSAGPSLAEPPAISLKAVKAALAMVNEYLLPMSQAAFGDAARPEAERLAAGIAKWIAATKPISFNARDMRRKSGVPGIRSPEKAHAALDVLVEAGWIKPSRHPTGGRRSSDYLVNPKVSLGQVSG